MSDITLVETYIGDGVYASFDGVNITLDLRSQSPTPLNSIVMEPEVLHHLLTFLKDMKKAFCTLNPEVDDKYVTSCDKLITL